VVETDEEAVQIVLAGFLDLASVDVDVVYRQSAGCDERVGIEPREYTLVASSWALSSNDMHTPGSP
jgi:hypothetical protein